jgi:hypothetical protein
MKHGRTNEWVPSSFSLVGFKGLMRVTSPISSDVWCIRKLYAGVLWWALAKHGPGTVRQGLVTGRGEGNSQHCFSSNYGDCS